MDHKDYADPQHRQEMISKMQEYERKGLFNEEVEGTHEYKPLDPSKIDFRRKKISSNLKTYFVNQIARIFINRELRHRVLEFDPKTDVFGGDNLKGIKGGAIVTLNHVNPYDHYIPYLAFRRYFGYWRFRLYKLVKESNYTYPGPVGMFMRNCNTIPISDNNPKLTIESMKAVSYWLSKGKKICIFAESSLWHHYRKPRPTKQGAFLLAAKNNVPVIPCFLTMSDTDKVGKDGLVVQKFVLNIMTPIFPDGNMSIKSNTLGLQQLNTRAWKECYERVYGIPLEYQQ